MSNFGSLRTIHSLRSSLHCSAFQKQCTHMLCVMGDETWKVPIHDIFFKKHQWKSWLFFYFCICWLAESFLAPIRLVRGHGGTFVPLICQILATLGPTSSLSYIIYDRSWSWQFLNKEVASDFKYTWSIYKYVGESQIIHENWGM